MKIVVFSILFFCPILAFAQTSDFIKKGYPQTYFINPLDIPIKLAGNFGECRSGHYHSGLDIKTLGEENKPVHASAEGYISRIKMDKGGFGHAIYITHPNGYTTLYAHLNDFAPEIQKYLRKQQYAQQKWDVDISFSPTDFPVSKGEFIAWSGNTGGSTAPHLHFEIRDSKTEHPLNPELFGFQIDDKLPPIPFEVFFYGGNIYEDSTIIVTLGKKGEVYKPIKTDNKEFKINKDTIEVWKALTGIGINTDDFMDTSNSTLAPLTIKLLMDDTLQSKISLDDIGYDESRYINAYIDYKSRQKYHKWVQLLFCLPGNKLEKVYTHLNSYNGRLNLTDNKVHKITIIITDDRDNIGFVLFFVKATRKFNTKIADKGKFSVNKLNKFSDPNVVFSLDERQLYDDIFFKFGKQSVEHSFSSKYMLHYPFVPIHHYFDLKIKPTKPVPFALRNKVVLKYSDGDEETGKEAKFIDNGWYMAKVRNFGEYWLEADTIPPTIKCLQKNANFGKDTEINLEVKDESTSIRNFNGYIDNKWVCFEQHNNQIFYKFDEYCQKGKHTLVFNAEDENGNKNIFKLNFIR